MKGKLVNIIIDIVTHIFTDSFLLDHSGVFHSLFNFNNLSMVCVPAFYAPPDGYKHKDDGDIKIEVTFYIFS